jgi:hypothetical protein
MKKNSLIKLSGQSFDLTKEEDLKKATIQLWLLEKSIRSAKNVINQNLQEVMKNKKIMEEGEYRITKILPTASQFWNYQDIKKLLGDKSELLVKVDNTKVKQLSKYWLDNGQISQKDYEAIHSNCMMIPRHEYYKITTKKTK